MGIVVQKFGGTSVESTEKLFKICKYITNEYDSGNKVIVVVSAQGDTTERLINEAKKIDPNLSNKRELDVLLSTGEQVTISKLAMCLNKLGYNAISLLGWQIPIKTNDIYGNADISKININRIMHEINNNQIVIIAGFQGINKENNNIVTLGRGGSDTTAVAIAAAVNAQKCELYKDVDGVYNKDPKKNSNAVMYKKINYDEMISLSNNGAKILHNKSVEIAKKFKVKIHIKSLYNQDSNGTYIL